jgi:homoserine kinase type II
MALLTPLSFEEARDLVRDFDLELDQIEALTAGSVNSNFRLVTNDGRVLFLRVYEEQGSEGAERELRLARELGAQQIAVAQPLARRDGRLQSEHAGKPVALFHWIEGELLCQKRIDPTASRRVGEALARVHLATPAVGVLPEGRFGLEGLRDRLDRIEGQASTELAAAARRIRERLAAYAAARDSMLPAGLIHGDLFRDNVLWRDGEIAALLDFESASFGPWLYDLMVTVLAWCYGSSLDPQLVRAMLQGYHSVRPLEARERASARVEAGLACLRFATTRITDYSMRAVVGQPPQRDYRRFLARLAAVEGGALDTAFAAPAGAR